MRQLLYFCAFACVFMWRLPRHLPNLPLIAALAPLAILAVHYKTYVVIVHLFLFSRVSLVSQVCASIHP